MSLSPVGFSPPAPRFGTSRRNRYALPYEPPRTSGGMKTLSVLTVMLGMAVTALPLFVGTASKSKPAAPDTPVPCKEQIIQEWAKAYSAEEIHSEQARQDLANRLQAVRHETDRPAAGSR